jgi:hypothetical protein
MKIWILIAATVVLSASVLLQAVDKEPEHHATPTTGHITVVPNGPAALSTAPTYNVSPGQDTIVPLPGPPTSKEVRRCMGEQLWTCLNTINLREVSGTLRLPATDGVAELQITKGTIVKVRMIPPEK